MDKITIIKQLQALHENIKYVEETIDGEISQKDVQALEYAIEAVKAYNPEKEISTTETTRQLIGRDKKQELTFAPAEEALVEYFNFKKDLQISNLEGVIQAYREIYKTKPLDK